MKLEWDWDSSGEVGDVWAGDRAFLVTLKRQGREWRWVVWTETARVGKGTAKSHGGALNAIRGAVERAVK